MQNIFQGDGDAVPLGTTDLKENLDFPSPVSCGLIFSINLVEEVSPLAKSINLWLWPW